MLETNLKSDVAINQKAYKYNNNSTMHKEQKRNNFSCLFHSFLNVQIVFGLELD